MFVSLWHIDQRQVARIAVQSLESGAASGGNIAPFISSVGGKEVYGERGSEIEYYAVFVFEKVLHCNERGSPVRSQIIRQTVGFEHCSVIAVYQYQLTATTGNPGFVFRRNISHGSHYQCIGLFLLEKCGDIVHNLLTLIAHCLPEQVSVSPCGLQGRITDFYEKYRHSVTK